jgi:hypothetical protein
MIYQQLQPGDAIFTESVESFMRKNGVPDNTDPQTRLALVEQYRQTLYSADAVALVQRIANYILTQDMETDSKARALWKALCHHCEDPEFISYVKQCISSYGTDQGQRGRIGALFSKVLDEFVSRKKKAAEAEGKKAKDGSLPNIDLSDVKHLQIAIEELLGGNANAIQMQCGNVTHPQALFIAACIAMNDENTLLQIIGSDLPISANIFPDGKNGTSNPDMLIRAALLLKKSSLPTKLTKNQEAFLTSLRDWVFTLLNEIPGSNTMEMCYQYLIAVYGSTKPDVSPYYIQIKDCGTSYSNLIQAAKLICNK